jgi:putative transcriptional regulator
MSITHHPEDATLMGFAAGTLTEPFGIIVAAHLELCATCRAAMRTLTDIGAVRMLAETPAELAPGSLDALMAGLDAPATPDRGRIPRMPPPRPANSNGLPDALARLVGGGLDRIKWRKFVPGAQDRRIMFKGSGGVHSLRFLRAEPGISLPDHAHVGTELTLVLQGALRDGDRLFGPGDVTDMDDEGTHNPIVHGNETCICVIANEAPPLFRQLKFRVLQKVIGI